MTAPASPAEGLRLNWWQRTLMPNLPVIAALAVLYLAVVVMGPEGLLNDSDTGWHIVTGERILDTGELPGTDPYSFSKPGEPWFAWEWLADVILGAAHKWIGLAGVALLASVAIAGTAWMWCSFALWLGGSPFVVAALMAVAISLSTVHWHARPHVFSWLFLIGWLWLAEKTPARLRPARLAGLFLMMAVWTNLHGSFFLAFFVTGAYVIQFWFEDRKWALTAVLESSAAFAATFCNPYGWLLHVHLVRYLTNSELLAQISEFQSPDFHGAGIYFLLLFLLAVSGAALSFVNGRYARALVALMFAAIALRSARGIPVVAFVALPLVADSLSGALGSIKKLQGLSSEAAGFQWIERQCNGIAVILSALLVLLGWFSTAGARDAAQFPAKRFPVDASREVAKLDSAARIFAPDQYGGYLIYRFGGARKVFFDGRSDYYGTRFVKDYVDLMALKPGWRKHFARYGFTHSLLPENHPVREALECAGWRRIYADKTAVLLARPPAPPPAPVCPMP